MGDTIYKNIAMAAALGSAQRDPAQARKDLAAGKFSPYLTAEQQREVINEIEQQERAAESEKARQEEAVRKAKADAAEESANDYTSRILLDPTKVSPKEIASDPTLDSVQKRVISNFLDEEIRKSKSGAEGDYNGGPGFWSTYNRVMSNGPERITDPMQLYGMAGPGKQLTLQGAEKLVALLKGRREGGKVGNFDAERQRSFFNEMHRNLTRDEYGTARLPTENYNPESAYYFFYNDKLRQIEEGQAKGKSLEQLLDPKSPDYIGKDWKAYVPPEPVDSYVPPTEEKPEGFFEGLSRMIFGSAQPKTELLDNITDGKQGLAALRAAIAAGMPKDAAAVYALKRGWIRPDQQVPAAVK